MRRIELWIHRLDRYRELQRWLAKQRQHRYDTSELAGWAQRDLNLNTPVEPSEVPTANSRKRSSNRSALAQYRTIRMRPAHLHR
ncbi:hypothetical protein [Saccharospirillum mangrovi]|uniref:hypothetical protein n=1 Tax=Saccharospirillum mangrovi TaxID=2161747 RepID=UPI000D34430F|nr:hypothetical protein [Saccharospirillum mangrovi]